MSTPKISSPGLLLASALLTLVLLVGACSDDSGGAADAGAEGTEQTVSPDDEEWCAEVRRSRNALPSQLSESIEAQADLAPAELEADYALVLEMMTYRNENPGDILGIREKTEAAAPGFGRVMTAIQERCGFTVSLLG